MCNLKKIQYPKSSEYRSGTYYEPILFFLDAFSESKNLDLLLGYFSSTALNVLALGITKFLANGGKMRIVINNVLSSEDKATILKKENDGIKSSNEADYTFDKILQLLDEPGKHTLECFAWLLKHNRIEIVAVRPKKGGGISHYKSGVFFDGTHKISFKGSCNFSAKALLENLEELGVKKSWNSGSEKAAIRDNEDYFEKIFSGSSDIVESIPFKEIEERIIDKFGRKELNDLMDQESLLLKKKQEQFEKNPILKERLEKLGSELEQIIHAPIFPYKEGPRDYQRSAYENWVANNFMGVFAMATGTGKTITSLNCLLEKYQKEKLYQTLILVPTNDLQNQWIKEVNKFNITRNIIVVGIDSHWKKKLSKLTTSLDFGAKKSYVIISTYASFTRNALQNFVKYLAKDTLLIADEAHNIGAPKVKAILDTIAFNKRIGLSATPKRIYDGEGTEAMNKFFNDAPPYTYEFSMEEAIAKGILCQYDYFPHVVTLNSEELEEYKEITRKLSQFFDADTKKYKDSDIVNGLLMKRKRIIHKAENKLPMFKQVIKHEFQAKRNLKYTFVYVPEGLDNKSEDADRIMIYYNQAIMAVDPSIRVSSFTGESADREETLKAFERGEIDVLSAMKCLDEGVDVPRAELAIFCSSTGNPRQFIQRRGRILRKHDDKKFATIHDLVVVPHLDYDGDKSATYNMERNQVINELKRVADFAFMARNQFEAIEKIQTICDYYNLDLFEIKENMK
ncbi:MAG: DEAD/DEAH box helicase family protein [Marinilabiliaceae bacterium]|nr:DEAD/DEAH box helicase family protein [Marinilabiliaceae bacterium]